MHINFMKVHQPNMPAPDFQGKSAAKTKFADSIVENDARIGRVMDKIRSLGLDENTYVFWTTDNGAWQDSEFRREVQPRQQHWFLNEKSGFPFRTPAFCSVSKGQRRLGEKEYRAPSVKPGVALRPRTQGTSIAGTCREGGARVPALAWGPNITAGSRNSDILGGLDYMATFASLAGVKLPENDREDKPIVFDSYDMSPVLFSTGPSARKSWFYFTENELTPGAVRVGRFKAAFNLRGDNGSDTGGLAVDSNLGRKGPEKIRRDCAADFRSLAGPAGALRHLHEQLY
jgi:arylsulfatase A-like enzyme